MIASIDYVKNKFGHFNRLIFNGELPEVPILPSRARTYLGRHECKVKRKIFGQTVHYDHRIRINTVTDFPENEIDDVIIHEMIHYYIAYKELKDTSAHGQLFRTMMHTINERFGRNISISKPRTETMTQQDLRIKQHFICVMELPAKSEKQATELLQKEGKRTQTAFTPVTEQSMFTLWTHLPETMKATSHSWYVSTDPFFNPYRKMSCGRRKPACCRAYPVEFAVLREHIAEAQKLMRQGRSIMAVKQA